MFRSTKVQSNKMCYLKLFFSAGSLENTPSPAGAGSIGSVGTPESICSSGSPGPQVPSYSPAATPDPPAPHLFKPVSPALSVPGGTLSHHHHHIVVSPATTFGTVGVGSDKRSSGSSSCPPPVVGEGSDASSDAMITEDSNTIASPAPGGSTAGDLKNFQQAMDLSESPLQPLSSQNSLNI